MKLVIALGGNALLRPEQRGTYEELVDNVKGVCGEILKVVERGHQIVLTHGNGPQVGNLALQQASTSEVPEYPLHVLGAMTQGEVGYLLQRELGNTLRANRVNRPVISMVTQVLVAPDDPSFQTPTKPIGPFYTAEEAERVGRDRGFVMKRVGRKGSRQYRRVVPSPDPVEIIESVSLRNIVAGGAIVIAGGGGGIPVVKTADSAYAGVDAVIDKDLCAEKIAEAVGADALLILTNVDKVKLGYGTPNERALERLTVDEARRLLKSGEFPAGSMGPKITACVRFVEQGSRMAIIASIGQAVDALDGSGGTRVVRE